MDTTHDLNCDCDTSAPGRARAWLRDLLGTTLPPGTARDEFSDDAELCLSELVANAVQAGCTRISLRCSLNADLIRVSVTDDAPGQPQPRSPSPSEPRGRGLHLVQALSRNWGVEPAGRGKQVWAELDRPPPARGAQQQTPAWSACTAGAVIERASGAGR